MWPGNPSPTSSLTDIGEGRIGDRSWLLRGTCPLCVQGRTVCGQPRAPECPATCRDGSSVMRLILLLQHLLVSQLRVTAHPTAAPHATRQLQAPECSLHAKVRGGTPLIRLDGNLEGLPGEWCYSTISTNLSATPVAADKQACESRYVDPSEPAKMEEIIARGSYGFDCSGGCARCSYELDIDKGVYRCVSEDSVYECPPAPNGGVDYLGRFEVAAAENSVTLGELRVLLPQELGSSTVPATTLDATQTYTLSIPSGLDVSAIRSCVDGAADASGERRRRTAAVGTWWPHRRLQAGARPAAAVFGRVVAGQPKMELYVTATFSSLSIAFNTPFESEVIHAQMADGTMAEAFPHAQKEYLGITKIMSRPIFLPGNVATVTFPAGTDMSAGERHH